MVDNFEVKGYNCEFVNTPPEIFLCRVCSLYLREPQITECCGRNLCLPCIQKSQKADGACPFCKEPKVKGALNRGVRKDLFEREVYCLSKNDGCPWKDKLEKLEKHTEECAFTTIDCPSTCGVQLKRQDLESHLQRDCQRYRLPCKCGEAIERCKQAEHLLICPLTKVPCPFSIAGCKAIVINKDMQCHMETSLADHLALVSKQTKDVQAQVKQAKNTIATKQAKKLEELDTEVATFTKAIVDAEEKAVSLEKVIQTTEVELTYLEEEKKKVSTLYRGEVARKDAEMQALMQQVYESQHLAKVKTYGIPVVRYSQAYARPTAPITQQFVPPLKFTVQKFTNKVNHDAVWFSPPFYTYQNGYKLCLKVFCNGYKQGQSKWISIYVQLLKGDYDHRLNWPFNGCLTVQVNNRIKNSRHLRRKIEFSNRTNPSGTARRRVFDGYLAEESIGWWNYATQGILFPSSITLMPEFKYVVDDTIEISVDNVEVY